MSFLRTVSVMLPQRSHGLHRFMLWERCLCSRYKEPHDCRRCCICLARNSQQKRQLRGTQPPTREAVLSPTPGRAALSVPPPLPHYNLAIECPWRMGAVPAGAPPRASSPATEQRGCSFPGEGGCPCARCPLSGFACLVSFSLPASLHPSTHLLPIHLDYLSVHLSTICLYLSWVISILQHACFLTGALSWLTHKVTIV